MAVQAYVTPAGYYDLPYIQRFDTSTISLLEKDTKTYVGKVQRVASDADFFIMRRIMFANCIVGPQNDSDNPGGFRYRDALGQDASSDYRPIFPVLPYPTAVVAAGSDGGVSVLPVCPEKIYPRSSVISFDISLLRQQYNGFNVYPTIDANTVPLGQILWWGVNRRQGQDTQKRDFTGKLSESYIYRKDVTVNWGYYNNSLAANGLSAPVRFIIPVTGWDFELMAVAVIGDQVTGTGTHCSGTARIRLYDWQYQPISASPISLAAFNQLSQTTTAKLQTGTPQGMGSLCPSLVYPDQSVIQFDISSLLSSRDTASNTITILFQGRRWYKPQGIGAR